MSLPLLTIIVFLPLAGAMVFLGFSRARHTAIRGCTLVVCADVCRLWYFTCCLTPTCHRCNFVSALPGLGVWAFITTWVDGISLPLVLLTTFLAAGPAGRLAEYRDEGQRVRHVPAGVRDRHDWGFSGPDVFLFFIFWEAMLIPMYFDWCGWGEAYLCHGEVCALYHGW
jgi:NADH:ubiquinone oxidoreductase subunit 4 (subunit M)